MRLVDGDKLCAETEADEGYIKGLFAHSVYVRSHTAGRTRQVAAVVLPSSDGGDDTPQAPACQRLFR